MAVTGRSPERLATAHAGLGDEALVLQSDTSNLAEIHNLMGTLREGGSVVVTTSIATPMFDRLGLSDDLNRANRERNQGKSPIRRFGTPEELANAILFLASDDASYMVGEEIVVDGGISLL